MKYINILVVSLTLVSCSDDNVGNLCGDYLSLKLNQSKTVAIGENVEASFLVVRVEDNRCPEDVVCIRAGEVFVDLKVNNSEVLNFCLGDCIERNKGYLQADTIATEVNNQDFKLVLRAVNSYPSSKDIMPQTACFEVLLME
ncbi:hypothetical protein [Fulvivirga lutimaris]|uniref:hypothetical protein n=1 Tax=Fulvivirga lutimaris TaxID=1819566 RepID=UPI0012BB6A94|nr:hypothetical protein [Fulvivirga lutimaris]MTI38294.1 hypothetical protein [Fulvivirga lutimaris]